MRMAYDDVVELIFFSSFSRSCGSSTTDDEMTIITTRSTDDGIICM
jgi:hypothetical protein